MTAPRGSRDRGAWLLAAMFALVGGSGAAAAEAPRAARWVAADAVAYLEVTRPASVLDRVSDERFQELLGAIPGYDRYRNNNEYQKFREVVEFVSRELGTTSDKGLRDLTGGGIVLAVEVRQAQTPRLFAFATPQDAEFLSRAHATLLRLARSDASEKGKPDPVQDGEHRGIKVFSVGNQEAHAIVEGILVVASGQDALHEVLDRILDKNGFHPALADDAGWKEKRSQADPDALAWAVVRIERLRELDPKRFGLAETPNPAPTVLFGPWFEAARKAPWMTASLTWTADRLGAELALTTPQGGYSEALKRFLPPQGCGAPAPINLPGTIASVGLWRDLASLWEVRADLLPPEAVQNLAKLDSFAGQFFGGRDFGTGVLGALAGRWQLVIARQNYQAMNPMPDVKLPSFALILNLKPDDDEFAERLKVAYQSFIGLANLGAAETKAPPLMLGTETVAGITISTAAFMPPKTARPKDEPVHLRQNFSPSVAQVGDRFIFSSSTGLARELIKTLQSPMKATDATLIAEADATEMARLVDLNRARLVMQNMVEKGNDKAVAEKEVGLIVELLRYLGHASLTVKDRPDSVQLRVNFALHSR